jgi:hypothetical protein
MNQLPSPAKREQSVSPHLLAPGALGQGEGPRTVTPRDVAAQLEAIAGADDFAARSAELVDAWSPAGLGSDAVEPVVRFIEQHPAIDFGAPGALVHFVERFAGKGYEERLLESVERRPTSHTIWMLNRVINGTKAPDEKRRLIEAMERARRHPNTDQAVRQAADQFLARFRR